MVRVLRQIPGQDTLFADPGEVKTAAEGMTDGVLACRELGHPWGAYVASVDRAAKCFERTLRCGRCGTLKVQTLSYSGHILGSHYIYPDGYLMEAGLGRIAGDGRAALRLVALERSVEKTVSTPRKRSTKRQAS